MVQEYLANPLLVNQKKFDLRVYVLVLNLGSLENEQPMLAFISDEALVRFCTEDYKKPSGKNLHVLMSHLTNFTLNKLSDKFVNSENLD